MKVRARAKVVLCLVSLSIVLLSIPACVPLTPSPPNEFVPPFPQVRPLETWWNEDKTDNYVGTQGGLDSEQENYEHIRLEGFTYDDELPGTVELRVYHQPETGDFVSTATAEGFQWAEERGYEYVTSAGWIYPDSGRAPPGTVALKSFWHAGRDDACSVATQDGEQAAADAGYTFLRTEGYVFNALPPSAEITRAEPNLLLQGMPTRVRLYGKHLYPYRFQETHHWSNSASLVMPPSGGYITQLDIDGQWVDIYLDQSAVTSDLPAIVLALFKYYGMRAVYVKDFQSEFVQVETVVDSLGESSPLGRDHPRVTKENGWKWSKRVGATVNYSRSRAGQGIDVVIQTFTGEKMECKTRLTEAQEGFSDDRVVHSRDGLNSKLLGLGSGQGDVRRHRAKFYELVPGRYYRYDVECWHDQDGGRTFTAAHDSYFRAPPPPDDPRDVQIAVWADHIKRAQPDDHYGDLDGAPNNAWKSGALQQSWVIRMLENARDKHLVDFGIVAGDVVDEDTEGKDSWNSGKAGGSHFNYLARFHSMLELFMAGTPVFPIHGNHDVVNMWLVSSGPVEDFFRMMATPSGRTEFPYNQWYSFDWGDTHVVALDIVAEEYQKPMRDEANKDGLTLFGPNSEQRKWLESDLESVDRSIRWRIIFHHGQPSSFDSWNSDSKDPDPWCGTTAYKGYCELLNKQNVDFVFTGHWGQGLMRHISKDAPDEDIIYSYRNIESGKGFSKPGGNKHGFTHVRFRDDAMILSRLWYGNVKDANGNPIEDKSDLDDSLPDPEFLSDENGNPAIGALYECFKYVPGAKSECAGTGCVEKAYTLERMVYGGCQTTGYDLMASQALPGLIVPCCNRPHPSDPAKCLDAQGQEVSKTVTITVLECDRAAIGDGCLRRQLIPIVINTRDGESIPHVTSEELLQECTPCVKDAEGHITGLSNQCGTLSSTRAAP